ncbi:MAG TPA: hypothetical protein VF476_15925 [Chitinophagaceae bacterium]
MKKILSLAYCLFISWASYSQQPLQHVNALLLDESYEASFGVAPDANSNEQLRIQTHLLYVEQLLRSSTTKGLSLTQQLNRLSILDILHEYARAGQFPTNKDYPGERRPCFIDADGNICAVGYLIEQTKGRKTAEAINAKHQYDFLSDMNEPVIDAWAKEFGLTLEECAMIQPAYGPPTPPETSYAEIKSGYGISSGILGGTNAVIGVANISGKWRNGKTLSYIGLISGTGQLVMGLANIKKSSYLPGINGNDSYTSYRSQNNLSYANIAVGTATVVSSIINLAMHKKNPDRRSAFGLYSYPNSNNSLTMGLSFNRRI